MKTKTEIVKVRELKVGDTIQMFGSRRMVKSINKPLPKRVNRVEMVGDGGQLTVHDWTSEGLVLRVVKQDGKED